MQEMGAHLLSFQLLTWSNRPKLVPYQLPETILLRLHLAHLLATCILNALENCKPQHNNQTPSRSFITQTLFVEAYVERKDAAARDMAVHLVHSARKLFYRSVTSSIVIIL